MSNLRRDVARLARDGRRPVAIDDQVPAFLIGSADRPLNRLEHLIPAIDPRLRVVVAAPRPLQVGDDGHVGPARSSRSCPAPVRSEVRARCAW